MQLVVSSKGFYLDIDGKYKDIDDDEEITTQELEHSEYGLVKYVVYDDVTHAVNWNSTEEFSTLPEDWVGEIV